MPFATEDRAPLASSAPVYAAAATDGTWQLRSSADDTVISSEHATVRAALTAALELDGVAAFVKSANLRTEGEPDGVWRWLDATAEEDAPIDGARIGELAIWQMAESLNARPSAVPINGGGAPAGLKASEAHGDAYTGGDHLANGFAHVGLVALHADGRPHLYLWSELLPEIAAEVDRGRLAYGSVRFGCDAVDEDDNAAALGAILISHALTNDPAVTTLTAGSERYCVPGRPTPMRARRSRWLKEDDMTTIDQIRELHSTATDETATPLARYRSIRAIAASLRGAAGDLLQSIADLLGIAPADMEGDSFLISDAIWALIDAAKVEALVEGASTLAASEGGAASVAASAEHAGDGVRSIDGLDDADLEGFASDALDLMRLVIGKPEALPADALSEAVAMQDVLAAAVEAAAASATDSETDPVVTASAAARAAARERDTARAELVTERAKVLRFETRDWLDGELLKIKKTLTAEKRARYIAIALESGRSTVAEFLADLNTPPQGNPLDSVVRATRSDIGTAKQAYDACMDDAEAECAEHEAAEAKRQRREPGTVQRSTIRACAQRLAAERYPEIVGATAAS